MAQKNINSILQLIQALKSEDEEDLLLKADMTISQPITITANKKITSYTNKLTINTPGGLTITKGDVTIVQGVLIINSDNAIIVNGSANPSQLICRATSIQLINAGSISYRTKGKITLNNVIIANESNSPAFKGQYTDAILNIIESSSTSTKAPLVSVQNGAKVDITTGNHKFHNLSENKDQPLFTANGNNSLINIYNGKYKGMSAYFMKLENGATGKVSGLPEIESTGPEEYNKPVIKIDGTGNTFNCSCQFISSAHGPILETTSPGNTIKITSGTIMSLEDVECLVMPAGNTLELTASFKGILKNDYLPQTHQWSEKDSNGYQTVVLKPAPPQPPEPPHPPQPGTGENPGQPQPPVNPPQPPVNPPQPPVNPGGGGTQPPQPPQPQPQELGKSLNIVRTIQLYQTPSRRYPISEWEGPVQILSEPITEQGTGEKFILVRVKLQGIGTWLTSYIRWNTTNNTPIADEFSRR